MESSILVAGCSVLMLMPAVPAQDVAKRTGPCWTLSWAELFISALVCLQRGPALCLGTASQKFAALTISRLHGAGRVDSLLLRRMGSS
ncbi:hypothetical protein Micbo1qcDRAFT_166989, partial [Microdochium bolleyi]